MSPAHPSSGAQTRRYLSTGRRSLCLTLALALTVTAVPVPPPVHAAPILGELLQELDNPAVNLAQLDLGSLVVPESLGYVVETWQPDDRVPSAFVIHLQDLHTHAQAQTHLSDLIGHFHGRLGVRLVALEGAEGICDTTLYSDLPDPSRTEQIARLFLQEGLFTGAEYYAITHPETVTLWGVEHEATYLEHLKVYQQGTHQQAEIAAILQRLRESIAGLYETHYPESLQTLWELREAYGRDEDAGFRPYFNELVRLAHAADVSATTYPHLWAAAHAYALYPTLDMARIEADRDRLLELLWPRLTAPEKERLIHAAQAVSTQQYPARHYYAMLEGIATFNGIILRSAIRRGASPKPASAAPARAVPQRPESAYQALGKYVDYLTLTTQIRSGEINRELEALQEAVETTYLTTARQRTFVRLHHHLTILDALIHTKLSPSEFRTYQRERAAFTAHSLWEALSDVTDRQVPIARAALDRLIQQLPAKVRFYELALARDEAFVTNTLQQLRAQTSDTAILIAGGFHTPGLTERLKAEGVAYAVITPKHEGRADEVRYRARLQNEIPPITDLLRKLDQQALSPVQATSLTAANTKPAELRFPPELRTDPEAKTPKLSKSQATFWSFLVAWISSGLQYLNGEQVIAHFHSWLENHFIETTMFGISLGLVGGKLVLSAMGVDTEFDAGDGAVLAIMSTPLTLQALGTLAEKAPTGWGRIKNTVRQGRTVHAYTRGLRRVAPETLVYLRSLGKITEVQWEGVPLIQITTEQGSRWLSVKKRLLKREQPDAMESQQAMYDLTPQHVVAILHREQISDTTEFLVQEYAGGETLETYLKRHRKSAGGSHPETDEGLLTALRTIGEVLATWHMAGYHHGDLKPDHIKINPNQMETPVFIDFGDARKDPPENGYRDFHVLFRYLEMISMSARVNKQWKDAVLEGYRSRRLDPVVERHLFKREIANALGVYRHPIGAAVVMPGVFAEPGDLEALIWNANEMLRQHSGRFVGGILGRFVLRGDAAVYAEWNNLNNTVEVAIQEARGKKSLTFEVRAQETLGIPDRTFNWLTRRSSLLDHVLPRLMHNANKYSPAGGAVTVTLGREGHDIIIRVTDEGIGIAPEEIPLVTQSQYRSQMAREVPFQSGAGLGLSEAKYYLERDYGGSLEVHSEGMGKGTTVTLRIPLGAVDGEGPAITTTGEALTSDQKQVVHKAIAGDFKAEHHRAVAGDELAGLDPEGVVTRAGVTVYEIPSLAQADAFLVAHPGRGGEAFNHELRQIYLSPARLATIRNLSPAARRQFWTHEIGHLDHPNWSETQLQEGGYPIGLVLADVTAQTDAREPLSRVIVEAVQLDPKVTEPDTEYRKSFLGLQLRLAGFRKRQHIATIPASGVYVLTVAPRQHVHFPRLEAGERYTVQPHWEDRLGLVIYFVRAGQAVAYQVTEVRAPPSKTGVQLTFANVLARETDLESARNTVRRNRDLIEVLRQSRTLDPTSPDAKAFAVLQLRLAQMRETRYTVTASPGGSYAITPMPRHILQFRGLSPEHVYVLQPYWEPGQGLVIYFLDDEVLGYRDRDYRWRADAHGKQIALAYPRGRALDLEAARQMVRASPERPPHRPVQSREEKRRLEDLIRASLALDVNASEDIANEHFELELTLASGMTLKVPPSGVVLLTPVPKCHLAFRGLRSGGSYAVEPFWIPGEGLVLYLVDEGEAIGYRLGDYRRADKGATQQTVYAEAVVRAPDLQTAREQFAQALASPPPPESPELKAKLGAIIVESLALSSTHPDLKALGQLRTALTAFRKRQFTIQPAPGGSYTVRPVPKAQLQFFELNPEQRYRLAPYWEPGRGLMVYFVSEQEVLGYGIGVKQPTDSHPAPYAHRATLHVRAKDLKTAREPRSELGYDKKQLAAVLLAGTALDAHHPDPKALADLERDLQAFRDRYMSVTPSPTGLYSVTPVRRRQVMCRELDPARTYTLAPYWETGHGLVLYFVSDGQTLGYGLQHLRQELHAELPEVRSQKTLYPLLLVEALDLHTARRTLPQPTPATFWAQAPGDIPDALQEAADGAYLGDEATSLLDKYDIKTLRAQAQQKVRGERSRSRIVLTLEERPGIRPAWRRTFTIRRIGGRTFLLPVSMQFSGDALGASLKRALAQEDLRELPTDEPYLILPVRHILHRPSPKAPVQDHLAGDHVSNRLILLHESLPRVVTHIEIHPWLTHSRWIQHAGAIFLQVLLAHELGHEATGQGLEVERELFERDLQRVRELAGDGVVEFADALTELGIVTDEVGYMVAIGQVEPVEDEPPEPSDPTAFPNPIARTDHPWYTERYGKPRDPGFGAIDQGYTYLDRHRQQVDEFRDRVLPLLVERRQGDKTLRLGVLGASTGEEVATLLAAVIQAFDAHPGWGDVEQWRVRIIGIEQDEDIGMEGAARLFGFSPLTIEGRFLADSARTFVPGYSQRVAAIMEALNAHWDWVQESLRGSFADATDPDILARLRGVDAIVMNSASIGLTDQEVSAMAAVFDEAMVEAFFLGTTPPEGQVHPFRIMKKFQFETRPYVPLHTLSYIVGVPQWAQPLWQRTSQAPASWTQRKAPEALQEADPGAYLEGSEGSRLTDEDIAALKAKVTERLRKHPGLRQLILSLPKTSRRAFWRRKFSVMTYGGRTILVPVSLNTEPGALVKLVGQALARTGVRGLPRDEPILILPVRHFLQPTARGVLRDHLAGDHVRNGVVYLHQELLQVQRALNHALAGAGDILVQVLLEHEFRHETTGEHGIEVEAAFTRDDLKRLAELAHKRRVDIERFANLLLRERAVTVPVGVMLKVREAARVPIRSRTAMNYRKVMATLHNDDLDLWIRVQETGGVGQFIPANAAAARRLERLSEAGWIPWLMQATIQELELVQAMRVERETQRIIDRVTGFGEGLGVTDEESLQDVSAFALSRFDLASWKQLDTLVKRGRLVLSPMGDVDEGLGLGMILSKRGEPDSYYVYFEGTEGEEGQPVYLCVVLESDGTRLEAIHASAIASGQYEVATYAIPPPTASEGPRTLLALLSDQLPVHVGLPSVGSHQSLLMTLSSVTSLKVYLNAYGDLLIMREQRRIVGGEDKLVIAPEGISGKLVEGEWIIGGPQLPPDDWPDARLVKIDDDPDLMNALVKLRVTPQGVVVVELLDLTQRVEIWGPSTGEGGQAPATWALAGEVPPALQGADRGTYLGEIPETRLTDDELASLKAQARTKLNTSAHPTTVYLRLPEKTGRDRWQRKFDVIRHQGRTFLVSVALVFPDGVLQAMLARALAQEDLSGLPADDPIILLPAAHFLQPTDDGTVQDHLAGDHVGNGLIILHEALPRIVRALNTQLPGAGDILLQLLLEHELRHEATHRGLEAEEEFTRLDVQRLIALAEVRGLEPAAVADVFLEAQVISKAFRAVIRQEQIELILAQLERLTATGGSTTRLRRQVVMTLLVRQLLHATGLVTSTTEVFNPMTGVDGLWGLGVDEMWTVDRRLTLAQMRDGVGQFHAAVQEVVSTRAGATGSILPPLSTLGTIHHEQTDVLEDQQFLTRWTSQMRSGDVVVLKFVGAYSGMHETEPMEQWLRQLSARIPPGVTAIVFESLEGIAAQRASGMHPDGLAGLLREAGFEDQLGALFTLPQRARWDRIQADTTLVTQITEIGEGFRVGDATVQVPFGGRVWILKKPETTAESVGTAAPDTIETELAGHYTRTLCVLDRRQEPFQMTTLRYVSAYQLTLDERVRAAESLEGWLASPSGVTFPFRLQEIADGLQQSSTRAFELLVSVRLALSDDGSVEGYIDIGGDMVLMREIRPDNRAGTRYRGVGNELLTAAFQELQGREVLGHGGLQDVIKDRIITFMTGETSRQAIDQMRGALGTFDGANFFFSRGEAREFVERQRARVHGFIRQHGFVPASPSTDQAQPAPDSRSAPGDSAATEAVKAGETVWDVETLLTQIEANSPASVVPYIHGTDDDPEMKAQLLRAYWYELRLFQALGLLTEQTRVFNWFTGVDWFWGLFAREMWTVDMRLEEAWVRDKFFEFYDALVTPQVTGDEIPATLVPPQTALCPVTHHPGDVLHTPVFETWVASMRPGDLVVLRFPIEYFERWALQNDYWGHPHHKVVDMFQRWVTQFIETIPEGLTVILYESQVPSTMFPEGLGSHLRASGRFRNARTDLTAAQIERLEKATLSRSFTDLRLPMVQQGYHALVLSAGGHVSILETVGGEDADASGDVATEQPAATPEPTVPVGTPQEPKASGSTSPGVRSIYRPEMVERVRRNIADFMATTQVAHLRGQLAARPKLVFGLARYLEVHGATGGSIDQVVQQSLRQDVMDNTALVEQSRPPVERERGVITEAVSLLRQYAQRHGWPFRDFSERVWWYPPEALTDQMPELTEGHLPVTNALTGRIFLPEGLPQERWRPTILHEGWHALSGGFPMHWLDEGMTEYLALATDYEGRGRPGGTGTPDVAGLGAHGRIFAPHAGPWEISQYVLRNLDSDPSLIDNCAEVFLVEQLMQGILPSFGMEPAQFAQAYVEGDWPRLLEVLGEDIVLAFERFEVDQREFGVRPGFGRGDRALAILLLGNGLLDAVKRRVPR